MRIDRHYVSERRREQKKRQKYFWGTAVVFGAYFLFLGAFAFVVRSPAFQVAEIKIEGASAVPSAAIISLLQAGIPDRGALAGGGWRSLLGFKNMLIWPDALSSGTLALIPRLASVAISKDYFSHTITATVTERERYAVWCLAFPAPPAFAAPAAIPSAAPSPSPAPASPGMGGGQCFSFDGRGVVFERTFDTEGNAIFTVRDYAQSGLMLGGKILPDEFVANLISILDVLRASGLGIREIALRDLALEQVDVATVNGPALHFSLRFPAANDLVALQALAAKPNFTKLQYVDFTAENRAYYK